jgi:hypothetical protein
VLVSFGFLSRCTGYPLRWTMQCSLGRLFLTAGVAMCAVAFRNFGVS